jgi:hypothetical protein
MRYTKEALGLLRPVGEERMDSNIAATERVCLADFWSVGVETSSPSQSEPKAAFSLGRDEALILVLLLSFGLWAVIWSGVALLAVVGW